ncbi:hypothetical protein H6P81_020593 [Aristolochia fimbriata]|uniref:Uncharacterized protein n=1 Tax=Aristolochia fimbriata TaxID=158543 RepID=A0AAV7DVT9_ARIFI|nr:hypothetical protein H6P81_020593 [Aristolochia fimbriata]
MASLDRLAEEDSCSEETFKETITCSSTAMEAEKHLEKEAFKEMVMAAIKYIMPELFERVQCPLNHFQGLGSFPPDSPQREQLMEQLILCSKPATPECSAMMQAATRVLIRYNQLPSADNTSPEVVDEAYDDLQHFVNFLKTPAIQSHFYFPTPLFLISWESNSNRVLSAPKLAEGVFREAINAIIEVLKAPSSSPSPEEALVRSIESLSNVSHEIKRELLKQIILAADQKASPPEHVVDQTFKEAISVAIRKSKAPVTEPSYSLLDLEERMRKSPNDYFIEFLVAGIAESVPDSSMTHAIVQRILFASKPILPEYSGQRILKTAFRSAIRNLQKEQSERCSLTDLVAAVERSIFPPLVKQIYKEILISAMSEPSRIAKRSKTRKRSTVSVVLPPIILDDIDEDLRSGSVPESPPPPSKFKFKQKFKVQK